MPNRAQERVDLLPDDQPVVYLQAVRTRCSTGGSAGTPVKAVMNEHHEHVAAQVDDPLGFVGRITERILVGLHEGAESIAAAV